MMSWPSWAYHRAWFSFDGAKHSGNGDWSLPMASDLLLRQRAVLTRWFGGGTALVRYCRTYAGQCYRSGLGDARASLGASGPPPQPRRASSPGLRLYRNVDPPVGRSRQIHRDLLLSTATYPCGPRHALIARRLRPSRPQRILIHRNLTLRCGEQRYLAASPRSPPQLAVIHRNYPCLPQRILIHRNLALGCGGERYLAATSRSTPQPILVCRKVWLSTATSPYPSRHPVVRRKVRRPGSRSRARPSGKGSSPQPGLASDQMLWLLERVAPRLKGSQAA